jgi:hypothetical protein
MSDPILVPEQVLFFLFGSLLISRMVGYGNLTKPNMKINADFTRFASAHFDATQYIASPSYGVNRFMLDRIGNEMARATTIVQYQPNS